MKNNLIAKNMHKFNKANIHIDRKKEGISKEEDVNQGLTEFFNPFNLTKEQLNKIGLETLEAYSVILPSDVDNTKFMDL